MNSQLLSDVEGRRQWAAVFDTGDEVMAELKQFANSERLSAAQFTGIGAFSELVVSWFDLKTRQYRPIPIKEQVEVLSLIGDVADWNGTPAVHAHICVAKGDGTAHGGHLLTGQVRPTLELVIVESPAHLRKSFKPEFGLPLIDLPKSKE